jgi:hypothetical protein
VRGASKPSSDQVEEDDPDRPMFSLITGRYRHAKRYGGELLYHLLSVPLFLAETRLQKTIGCLRHHPHPRPLFSEIKVTQSRHSMIPLLVCPFLFCATYQRLLLIRPLAKANFYNHERSVASKHVQGWIHLVSSNKDGAVSRGAMMMTIELRMSNSKRNTAYIKCWDLPNRQLCRR